MQTQSLWLVPYEKMCILCGEVISYSRFRSTISRGCSLFQGMPSRNQFLKFEARLQSLQGAAVFWDLSSDAVTLGNFFGGLPCGEAPTCSLGNCWI